MWIVLFLLSMFCGATSASKVSERLWVQCEVLRPDRTFPPCLHPPVHQDIKWNTPLGFHWRRSGGRPGCWTGNPGCRPDWPPSLPGFGTSLFSGRGIWRLSPGRSRPQRSPPLWGLQSGGHRWKYIWFLIVSSMRRLILTKNLWKQILIWNEVNG